MYDGESEMTNYVAVMIAVFAVLYFTFIVSEKLYHKKLRHKLTKVIHVNGTRGKSTVTRLIDAGIRECGFAVASKTTGTVPTFIDVSGTPRVIQRMGPANIREQLKVLRWATKQGAQYLVVECMAVNPELQYICEHQILNSDITVITNVRKDHLDEMGPDLESIAYSLANTVPSDGTVVLGEAQYGEVFRKVADKVGSSVVIAEPYAGEDCMDTMAENIATALQVCRCLNLDEQTFFNGMKKYIRDPGALSFYKLDDTVFINAFSVNDPQSTLEVYKSVTVRHPAEEMTILLNARSDRPFRIAQHIEMLTQMTFKKVIITGSNQLYVLKQLQKKGIFAERLTAISQLKQEHCVFGCGNIADEGMKITEFFKANGVETNG